VLRHAIVVDLICAPSGAVRSVALASGEVVESDAVVIAMGAYPGEVVKRKKKLSKK
jgi:hypothetical protein